jgi:SAM-dependent methyltransferase
MPEFQGEVYDAIRAGAQSSAAIIAPMLHAHVGASRGTPTAVDVGCGEGWWSRELAELGYRVTSIDQAQPELTAEGVDVQVIDLEADWRMHPNEFDLGLCLEVAEHLTPAAGDELVRQLVKGCRVVAWSAAIPGQGGHGHLNEQWPSYWAERFAAHGWAFADPWRLSLWHEPGVEPWYAQNLLLAMKASPGHDPLDAAPIAHLVHPAVYTSRVENAAYWREQFLRHDDALARLLASSESRP